LRQDAQWQTGYGKSYWRLSRTVVGHWDGQIEHTSWLGIFARRIGGGMARMELDRDPSTDDIARESVAL